MWKRLRYFSKSGYRALKGYFAKKAGALSFSGLITIISALMVINIYLSLYSGQMLGLHEDSVSGGASANGGLFKDLIYVESAMCFIALVSLGFWFRTLRSRLFSLVDAAREMVSADSHSLARNNRNKKNDGVRESIFSEMIELAGHMRKLHGQMVYFATLSGSISTMLNNLGQGILVVTADGKCSQFHSKVCEDLFEVAPAGIAFADLLKIPEQERATFDEWLAMLFEETIAFEDLAELAPKMFNGSKGRQITLELKPVRNEENKIERILLIATDRTREFEAEVRAKQNREKVEMTLKISKDREMFRTLIRKCRELVAWIRTTERRGAESSFYEQLGRAVHTVKGSAGSFFMSEVVRLCHDLESELAGVDRNDPKAVLDLALRFVAPFELALTSILVDHADFLGSSFEYDGPTKALPLQSILEFHSLLDPSLKADSENLREQFFREFICVPIRGIISNYEGRLQEVARKLGKQIGALRFNGSDIRVHQESNEDLFFSLVHIFNNIADHGIEAPEERRQAGKPPIGTVSVDVRQIADKDHQDWVEIRISDNGRGVDAVKIRSKLQQQGKLQPEESDLEVIQHIFDADFSTRDQATELSGRGIGLHALKTAVLARKGSIFVTPSKPYGTTFIIRVPQVQLCGETGQVRENQSLAA